MLQHTHTHTHTENDKTIVTYSYSHLPCSTPPTYRSTGIHLLTASENGLHNVYHKITTEIAITLFLAFVHHACLKPCSPNLIFRFAKEFLFFLKQLWYVYIVLYWVYTMTHLSLRCGSMKRRKYQEESTNVSMVSVSLLAQHPGLHDEHWSMTSHAVLTTQTPSLRTCLLNIWSFVTWVRERTHVIVPQGSCYKVAKFKR